ncbi:MAG TPA: hypothetical protein VFE88_01975 [Candidatus Nanoarchaeia archaeon]|nr:hypothetical protein [Candidatus Nanoarchaeia archaeon]
MAEKCSQCGQAIEQSFLGKIQGTYTREGKKLSPVCSKCQKRKANT